MRSDGALSTFGGGTSVRKEFVMRSIQGRFITEHSSGGGAPFILTKLLSGFLKPKKLNILASFLFSW